MEKVEVMRTQNFTYQNITKNTKLIFKADEILCFQQNGFHKTST